MGMHLDHETAREWIAGWDRRHEREAACREERLTVIADVVGRVTASAPRPSAVDLGSGSGTLAARLAERTPGMDVIAVDGDPLLLELGRQRHGASVRFVAAVIGRDGWTRALGLDRPLDAAVSTGALQHLSEPVLFGVYEELHRLLRPGGVLVNAGPLPLRGPRLTGRRRTARPADEEDWSSWWAAQAWEARRASMLERRELSADGMGTGLGIDRHIELLRRAGFPHAGPVWRAGRGYVLAALR
ncbi:class I SAM-dependent methyltransferase [Actinomadura roseirufa]|uniref:class I SAM-dependent methyltransferase n=1 Tax=Actinomadura roseirufa TaxID=2094049 RepID=UPI001A95560B|nr:class I SAM-dependent methyltransferase [Actinomadura roseirufa]